MAFVHVFMHDKNHSIKVGNKYILQKHGKVEIHGSDNTKSELCS